MFFSALSEPDPGVENGRDTASRFVVVFSLRLGGENDFVVSASSRLRVEITASLWLRLRRATFICG
jgi:hypothetical protein